MLTEIRGEKFEIGREEAFELCGFQLPTSKKEIIIAKSVLEESQVITKQGGNKMVKVEQMQGRNGVNMNEERVLELVKVRQEYLHYTSKPVNADLQEDGLWRVFFDNGEEDLFADFDLETLERELNA